jgi:hypothetical protein
VRKNWNGKKKCISVLVLAVAVVAMAATSAYGASAIDTDAEGSITLKQQMECTELSGEIYDVPLYLVATVDATGKYTLTKDFDVDELSEIESVNSDTTASEWEALAAAAKAVVGEDPETSQIVRDTTVSVTGGEGTIAGLKLGLYLAYVPTRTTDTYVYVADPLLIAVPGNNYGTLDADGNEITDDGWLYNVENNLKFSREDRYGNLTISKTIDTFNTSLGNASFVFQVTAVKDYKYTDETTDPQTVYNNVVSIDFSAAGTKSVPIEGIPAGAKVTVTEVYSGANYSAAGASAQSTDITADQTAVVSFANTYDNTLITGGNAVVNNFSYDEEKGWTWTEYIDDEVINSSATE